MEVIEINKATKVAAEMMEYIFMMAITGVLSAAAAVSVYGVLTSLNIEVGNPLMCVVSIAGCFWSATGIMVVVRSN